MDRCLLTLPTWERRQEWLQVGWRKIVVPFPQWLTLHIACLSAFGRHSTYPQGPCRVVPVLPKGGCTHQGSEHEWAGVGKSGAGPIEWGIWNHASWCPYCQQVGALIKGVSMREQVWRQSSSVENQRPCRLVLVLPADAGTPQVRGGLVVVSLIRLELVVSW